MYCNEINGVSVEKMSSSEDGSASVMNTTADGSSPNSTKNGVAFETIVHVTAYLDLLDEFETAKKKIAEQDRSQRQAEYPEGRSTLFLLPVMRRILESVG